ncbi:MAG: ethanolamine ammonia-lyase subunit EutC [Burkholderiales bacterium]|nr:ethanolamine ammonia-lyase subunit EutC [Burkholderiales bacterium]
MEEPIAIDNASVQSNDWQVLRQFTAARIALGRAGSSLPTAPQLAFQLAHAQARDAVHWPLPAESLAQRLQQALAPWFAAQGLAYALHTVHSAARDRREYLQRPDLGRKLSPSSQQQLQTLASAPAELAIVIADGLSALAIEQQTVPFLQALLPRLAGWRLAPLTIALQARVALGDEIGHLLNAEMVLVLIGERPGLSSPDSMGLYLSYQPRPGLVDANRNCISNVRPAGLSFDEASYKLHYLLEQARSRQLTGVDLKDETVGEHQELDVRRNFLLAGE